MKILISEFRQESNSLSPRRSDLGFWRENGWLLPPHEVASHHANQNTAVAGMLEAVSQVQPHATVWFGPSWYSQSGGTVEQDVMDAYWADLLPELHRNGPLDAVLLSCHGALQTTAFDDAEAELARRVRAVVGPDCVLAMSTDMHGHITADLIAKLDILCGYHTYPHEDFADTGRRAATLALETLLEASAPTMAWVPVPMMVSASAYNTLEGPYRDLHRWADSLVAEGHLIDYSIYQMQPWLDLPHPNSSIITIGRDEKTTAAMAEQLARRLYGMRHQFEPQLLTIDEIIDLAGQPATPSPVVLVDSADSPNAGAPGDSMAVAARLIDSSAHLRVATVVVDPDAAQKAHRLGPGAYNTFLLGGAEDPRAVQVEVHATVRSVHPGKFELAAPGSSMSTVHLGPTAVLRVLTTDAANQAGQALEAPGKHSWIDVLVCSSLAGSGDPALYRSFGMNQTDYDLVVVKANTSFRAAYRSIAGVVLDADTPGAAAPVIRDLPFTRVEKTIYPWVDNAAPDFSAVIAATT